MGSRKRQKAKDGKGAEFKGLSTGEAVPAVVEELIGRTGFRGELTQVRVKILDGPEQGKTMRRNVKGPIKVNDLLMLRETQIEARRIRSKVMKGAFT
ncbi:MAG: 30S ribosomal protein S28e [archaeon]|nr:MAG: 30S ribosomal protein S28e [archaeon]